MAIVAVACVHAERIVGTVVIKKKLTKRRVTAEVPMYQRGPAVELSADQPEDPMAFERSRVAVYLEGRFKQAAQTGVAAKMEQTNRRFSPETLVIQAGSKVSFPNNDPIFHTIYDLDDRFQVPSQSDIYGEGYSSDEKTPYWRGIYDKNGRIMVAMVVNSDLGDSWEWADSPYYPEEYASLGIRVGLNYILYGMTH